MTQREFTDRQALELQREIRTRADKVWSTCPEEWLTEQTRMGLKIGLFETERIEAEYNEAIAGIPYDWDCSVIRSRIESRIHGLYEELEEYTIECFER